MDGAFIAITQSCEICLEYAAAMAEAVRDLAARSGVQGVTDLRMALTCKKHGLEFGTLDGL